MKFSEMPLDYFSITQDPKNINKVPSSSVALNESLTQDKRVIAIAGNGKNVRGFRIIGRNHSIQFKTL